MENTAHTADNAAKPSSAVTEVNKEVPAVSIEKLPASYRLSANDPRMDTSAPSTDEIAAAAQGKAVILQPEQAATVFRKKLDKEMDELLPAPPNRIQKILRILAYPLSLYIGSRIARTEILQGTEKLASENGVFDNMKYDLHKAREAHIQNPGEYKSFADRLADGLMDAHEKEKKELLAKEGFASTTKWEKMLFGETSEWKMYKGLAKARKAQVKFIGAATVSLSLGLLLTLSDNKNFLSFRKKVKEREKETMEHGHDHESGQSHAR